MYQINNNLTRFISGGAASTTSDELATVKSIKHQVEGLQVSVNELFTGSIATGISVLGLAVTSVLAIGSMLALPLELHVKDLNSSKQIEK